MNVNGIGNKTFTQELQKNLSPESAVELLKQGNKRFVSNVRLDRDYAKQVSETGGGQFPFACILGCIDSRVPAELAFDLGVGDIFNVRIAGNFVNNDILGSMEFACKVAGSKLIVVLGHTECGAIKGACDSAKLGNLTGMLENFDAVIDSIEIEGERSSGNKALVEKVTHENVHHTISKIKADSPVLNEMISNNEIAIVGAIYDVKTGIVNFLN